MNLIPLAQANNGGVAVETSIVLAGMLIPTVVGLNILAPALHGWMLAVLAAVDAGNLVLASLGVL